MRKQPSRPPKPQKPIAVAITKSEWPAWMPRPAPQPAPEKTSSEPSAEEEIRFESELPSVAEVRAQTVRAPAARRSRADDDDDHEDSIAAQTKLVKIIGSRMREAREELAGLSQKQAADLLGYANSSKLAKIEGATDTRSVPLQTILKAAELYQVSVDFIFGASDDWERDPAVVRERAVGRWLFEHLDKARTRDAAAFAELAHRVETVTTQIGRLADGAEQSRSAFNRFRDINPGYEDMIGGARLQAALEALDEAGRQARLRLRRLHLELAGQDANTGTEGVHP